MAKILVVDDEEPVRLQISRHLEQASYQVVSAGNGAEALSRLASFLPDLILCDTAMPVMDGLNLIRNLKRNVRYWSIPVLLLTAGDSAEAIRPVLEAGASDCLDKACLTSELLRKITTLTNPHRDQFIDRLQQPAAGEKLDVQFISQFTEQLEHQFGNPQLSATDVARGLNMNVAVLQRNLNRYFHRTFGETLKAYRLLKAADYLTRTNQPLSCIAAWCGFNSLSYFSYSFKEANQVSPLRFRLNNRSVARTAAR